MAGSVRDRLVERGYTTLLLSSSSGPALMTVTTPGFCGHISTGPRGGRKVCTLPEGGAAACRGRMMLTEPLGVDPPWPLTEPTHPVRLVPIWGAASVFSSRRRAASLRHDPARG